MIETRGLTKRYGETVVVDNVSVRIPRGGVTSIIGPNGAGKSTLLSLISRLIPPTSGTVTIDGTSIASIPSRHLATLLSILRQDNHFSVRLTVSDLVAFGRYPYSRGRLTPEDRQHVDNALNYLGMTGLKERFVDELSGGQRQRVFLAMVLCQDTDYLLLDEPLNSLDIKHAAITMHLLRRAADELNKTIITVLHDINFAAAHSDRVIGMKDGRIFCDGGPDQVFTPDNLSKLFEIEMSVQVQDKQTIVNYFTAVPLRTTERSR
ncbi:ATP-binding cassette domain-containing protein [Agrobacterium sp. BA1120]|uniref:iron ABC transporter ATP-binding protein n=1 Tax=Agrobacterium sp. BA1120 TaxID=3228927 RepID=UPI003369D5E7